MDYKTQHFELIYHYFYTNDYLISLQEKEEKEQRKKIF